MSGTEIMIGTMVGDAKEIETGIETVIETGTEKGTEIAIALEMIRIMVGIEKEIGKEKVGIGIGETEIVGGAGVAQEAGAAAGIDGIATVKMGTTGGSMPAAVLALVEGMKRMSRSTRRRRKRRRRRAMEPITLILRLRKLTGFELLLV